LGPETEWTSEQRQQVQGAATAIRNATSEAVELARQTPHRVVRELYEQFIAYGREYADSIPNYTPADNYLASANVSAGRAITALCNAITYGATNRALAVESAEPPTDVADVTAPDEAQPLLVEPNQICSRWLERDKQFNDATADWQNSDTNLTADQWSPEQRSIQLAALPQLTEYASDIESLGEQSDNPVIADFTQAAAIYLRAYVSSGTSYVQADSFLASTAFRFGNTVTSACQAQLD
jgi:hypothetical protein